MRLAANTPAAAAETLLYTVPAGRRAVFTLNACNRNAAQAKVRIALTNGAAPVAADWIEFDTPIPGVGGVAGSVLVRTGLALAAGQRLYVRSDVVDVSFVVFGIEEAA